MDAMSHTSAHRRRLSRFAVALACAIGAGALSGCVGAAVGGAATVGVAAYDERGVDGVAQDFKVASEIRVKWINQNEIIPTKISVEVHEGRALLTGVVQDEGMRADAVRLAYAVPGVKQVLNEIQLSPAGSVADYSRDAWITTQIKSKITLDEKILAINYKIETVNKTVYMIGIAQNQEELDRVLAVIRGVAYVRNIVNHVRVKGAKS